MTDLKTEKRARVARTSDSRNDDSRTSSTPTVASDSANVPENIEARDVQESAKQETESMNTPKNPTKDAANFDASGSDVFPDFAVEPQEVTRRTQMLRDYVREHMIEGEDYGIIPGGSKPTLFKPGAEKLNAVYGLSPLVEVTNRIEDWDSGFVAYEVKVQLLNKRSDRIEAEGIGSCNSRERRYKNQDAAGVANTVLKMAKKRALVDATLSATRASGMFTQDLEDIDFEPERANYAPREARSVPERDRAPQRVERPAPRENGASAPSSGDLITEAQQRAVMAIAGRVFGRHSRDEDLVRMTDKPLEQLSKSEASALIDRLRAMLNEAPGSAENEPQFVRASERRAR